jgi:hypothetical protein
VWSCWSDAARISVICAAVLTVGVCMAVAVKWVLWRKSRHAERSALQPLLTRSAS